MIQPKPMNLNLDRTIYTKKPYVMPENTDDEFRQVEQALITMGDFMVMNETTQAPAKEDDFHIRFADGNGWNPDGKGRGLYMYFDGKWNKFSFS